MENNILLSICIPTYNGAERIAKCLDFVIESVGESKDVEIVVSDNGSTDNTQNVLKQYINTPFIRLYRNDKNLGFNGNMRLLLDKYAVGQYCWMIGDDDLIDRDAISKVKTILQIDKPEFMIIQHRFIEPEEISSIEVPSHRLIDYIKCSYFQALDLNASPGNVLGTFMSSHIFKLERIRNFDKTQFTPNTWTNFKTTFPNSYMMTSSFYKDSNCGYISTPIISAISHPKSWDNKMKNIVTNVLPTYYNLCVDLAGSKKVFRNTLRIIRAQELFYNLLEIKKHNYSVLFTRSFWRSIYMLIPFIIKRMLR